jgi:hypothetical protein
VALKRAAGRAKAACAACTSPRRRASLLVAEGFTPTARQAPQKNESHPAAALVPIRREMQRFKIRKIEV